MEQNNRLKEQETQLHAKLKTILSKEREQMAKEKQIIMEAIKKYQTKIEIQDKLLKEKDQMIGDLKSELPDDERSVKTKLQG